MNRLIDVYLNHCPNTLQTKYRDNLINNVPDTHKKAIMASSLASRIVYKNGIDWEPSVVSLLSLLLNSL